MGLLNGRVVVITGAGRGIGRAHALRFSREGAKVVVNDLGTSLNGSGVSTSIADQVVKKITTEGGEAIANYDDVASMNGGQNIINSALDNYGRIDVLVNNAGILRDKTLLKMEEDMWDSVINVHLKGTFSCTQAAASIMREQGTGGSIINTTSFTGLKGNFGQTNYGAAKAGIVGFTLNAAIELNRYNITVNCIAPMAITRMKSPVVREDMTPETITPVVLFLASDKARDITGRIIGIHGQALFEYQIRVTNGVEKQTKDLWTINEIAEKWDLITM
ncbi:MAG: SDR family NAD(P)-dependent oxidoreductase [Candidatus Heimdallarchaeota archaeon]|nr:MAG: SDR family NAD(P)-dependent oxidoreductase [Candidatus Heimdallarchaeota archaeon]